MVIVGDSVLSRRITILLLAVIVLLGVGAWSPSHAQSCPCTIWTPSTVPGTANANDPRSVEVGVKFRSDVAGFVTAVRFYKGSQNTGTHTGSLWAAGGALLGRVTFTNETASGWQQATFATPIAIAANTTYVASYFAPVGRYSFNSQYFQTATDRPPLHALATSVSANGVFRYAGSPAFPNQTFNASNYWVDVVFTTSTGPDVTPPTVTSVTPANGASSVNVGTTVTATFSEPMNATTINTDTFQLESAAGPVAGTVTYNATTRVATLTPGSALATGTAYTATVRGGLTDPRVKDVAGNALASSMTWSFTTAATTDTTPPTVTSVSPAGGATNVDTATTVTATFSEAMDATTISGDTFQLRDPGNTLISALVTYNATTRVATLAPSGALAQATTYTATVRGGTTDPRVKDVAGNALATSSVWSFTTSGGGGTPCTANPIVCENQKPGNPDTDWDVAGAGDPSIQGFATDISVNKGQTVRFKISTGASAYRLDIYRMGFYGGNGARRVATIRPSIPLPQSQPPCLSDGATGLVDCGNWAESVSWPVPADATSGI